MQISTTNDVPEEQDDKFERITTWDMDTDRYGDQRRVAFQGHLLADGDEHDLEAAAYSTRGGRIAVENVGEERLELYDDFDEFAAAWGDGQPEFVYDVAKALGEDYVVELDI